MRRSAALLAALLTVAAAAGPATAAKAKPKPKGPVPVRLYFHSAAGTYFNDWQADRAAMDGKRAPAGSTLGTAKGTRPKDSSAQSASPQRVAGMPTWATFSVPWTGTVTNLCLDVWIQAELRPIPTNQVLYLYSAFQTPEGKEFVNAQLTQVTYDGSLVRFTAVAKPAANTVLTKGSTFTIGATNWGNNPNWTMYYGSAEHASSITINPKTCKA